MVCPECNGKGYVVEWGVNYLDSDEVTCYKCNGTGEIFSVSDAQPWDKDHPRYGRFTSHSAESKWKRRFVVSGCESPNAICEFMTKREGVQYHFVQFNELDMFPGENETYQYPCVYFFPETERKVEAELSKAELTELYWY